MSATDVATTALVPFEEKGDELQQEVTQEAAAILARAQSLEVTDPQTAEQATALLGEIQQARREREHTRKWLVDPLNQQVKRINDKLKAAIAPFDAADQVAREKVVAYQTEQERRQQEEEARLRAEREAAERAAEEQRRRAAEEAARAEREAQEAEQRRQAQIAAQQDEKRRLIGAMDDDGLRALIANDQSPTDEVEIATGELDARREAREAQERAAQARAQAEEALQREIATASAPAPAVAPLSRLSTARTQASVRREWKATAVVDLSQVPPEYLEVNMAAVNRAVRAGAREIPGIRIEQVAGLAVRGQR